MRPPLYMWSVGDRNVVMWRISVFRLGYLEYKMQNFGCWRGYWKITMEDDYSDNHNFEGTIS